jgi:hypothetical protein
MANREETGLILRQGQRRRELCFGAPSAHLVPVVNDDVPIAYTADVLCIVDSENA